MDGRVIYQLIVQDNTDISVWAQAVAESKQPPFAFYVKRSHDVLKTKQEVYGEQNVWDVYCITTSYAATTTMANAIKDTMATFTSPVTWTEGSTPFTQRIDSITLEDENDEYDEDSGLYAKILTFKFIILS